MLSKDYIVGLTDGEGSFTFYVRPPSKKYQAKSWRIECHFYIKMREDELPLLKEVHHFFGCGRISFQRDKRLNHRNCYRFEVSDLDSLALVVIPFFKENHLYSVNRKNDFKAFCKAIDLVRKKAQQNKSGLREVLRLKRQMHKK